MGMVAGMNGVKEIYHGISSVDIVIFSRHKHCIAFIKYTMYNCQFEQPEQRRDFVQLVAHYTSIYSIPPWASCSPLSHVRTTSVPAVPPSKGGSLHVSLGTLEHPKEGPKQLLNNADPVIDNKVMLLSPSGRNICIACYLPRSAQDVSQTVSWEYTSSLVKKDAFLHFNTHTHTILSKR
jgi:hypothetical protein